MPYDRSIGVSICDRFAPLRFRVVDQRGTPLAVVASLCEAFGLDVDARVTDMLENRGHWATVIQIAGHGACIPLEQVPFFLVCIEREDVSPAVAPMLDAVHRQIAEACSSPAMRAVTRRFLADLGERPASLDAHERASRIVSTALRGMRRRDA
jgi:hypothetical protein